MRPAASQRKIERVFSLPWGRVWLRPAWDVEWLFSEKLEHSYAVVPLRELRANSLTHAPVS